MGFSFLEKIKDLIVPLTFVVLTVLFIFSIVAICVREQKSNITGRREEDIFDRYVIKKKAQLKGIPGAPKFSVYIAIMAISTIVLGALCFVFFGFSPLILLGVLGGFILPELVVKIIKNNNDKTFDERYGRALRQMASTLRSGLTIQQAVEDIVNNPFLDGAIKDMFAQIDADVKVGIPMAEAFKRAAEDYPSYDTKDMAAAIAMQMQVGGSEAEIVDVVSNNINNRIMARKEVKTLFSGARMTVLTMDFMPPLMLLFFINSTGDMMSFYFEGFLNFMVLVAILLMMGIGSIVCHKMMNKAKEGIV